MSPKPARLRLDQALVDKGLAPSRERARAMILAGLVSCQGRRLDKPGARVAADAEIVLAARPRFVGRGGEKLDGALAALGLDVGGVRILDVGASTGGFTDCLLQRGASRVVALDVGRGQLDWSLRNDSRVTVLEGINVRYVDPSLLPGPFDLIAVDVSFISLRLVLPALVPLLSDPASKDAARRPPDSEGAGPNAASVSERPTEAPWGRESRRGTPPLPAILALVKPQFEVGRGRVGRGGIVRDPEDHLEVLVGLVRFAETFAADRPQAFSLGTHSILRSEVPGADGNQEFFVLWVPGLRRSREEVEREAAEAVHGSR